MVIDVDTSIFVRIQQGTDENWISFDPRYAWYRKESDWMSLTGIWNKKVGSKHEPRQQTKTYPQQCTGHTVFREMLAWHHFGL